MARFLNKNFDMAEIELNRLSQ